MWRFFNGLSRGLRTRTPAPPSQTVSHNEEGDNVSCCINSSAECSSSKGDESTTGDCIELKLQQDQNPENSESDGKIKRTTNNGPSKADILLREVFGDSWKNPNYESNRDDEFDYFETERIRNSLTLGTAWMTVLVIGRGMITSWRSKCRRRQICTENHDFTLHDYEQRYIHEMQKGFFQAHLHSETSRLWLPRLSVLPTGLSPPSVLCAGGDPTAHNSNNLVSFSQNSLLDNSNTGSSVVANATKHADISRKKSVTFGQDFLYDYQEELPSESSSIDDTISEEVLEQFSEQTKDFSGTTYNILGLKFTKSGDHKQAIDCFKLGSNEGHAKSIFNLGLCYQKGLGTEENIQKASEQFEKAAHKGHTSAQYNLALILIEKEDFASKIHAFRLLEKASFNGCVKAQAYLGVLYTKQGEFQNFKKAVKAFKLAAENGDPASNYHLGICYEKGLGGLKKDLMTAFDLYSSAATHDHLDAKYNMAVMLQTGFPGLDKNPRLAKELYRSAAKAGHKPSVDGLKKMEKQENSRVMKQRQMKPKLNGVLHIYRSEASLGPEDENEKSRQTYQGMHLRHVDGKHITSLPTDNSQQTRINPSQLPNVVQLSALRLMNGKEAMKLNPFSPLYGINLSKLDPLLPNLAKNPLGTDDVIGMKRSSTSPANLCYLKPLVKEQTAFSLEV